MADTMESKKVFKAARYLNKLYEDKGEEPNFNQIARNAGVAYNTVARFFNQVGYPRYDTSSRICEACGVDIENIPNDGEKAGTVDLDKIQLEYYGKYTELYEEEKNAILMMIDAFWKTHHMNERKPHSKRKKK